MSFDPGKTVENYATRDIEDALWELSSCIESIEKFEERPADLTAMRSQLMHTAAALRSVGFTLELIQDALRILATGENVPSLPDDHEDRFNRRTKLMFGKLPSTGAFGQTDY